MANFLLAILIFAAFFATLGMPQTPSVAYRIAPGSAAERAGLDPGDRIVAVDGRATASFEELATYVILRPDQDVTVNFVRERSASPDRRAHRRRGANGPFGQQFRIGRLGISPRDAVCARCRPLQLIPASVGYTVRLTRSMMDGLWQIVTGLRSAKDLGGPLKIAQIAGQQASLGAFEFVQLLALFSINLGFINLLPVPVLDGGHLFFYALKRFDGGRSACKCRTGRSAADWHSSLRLLLFTTFNDLGSFGLWDRLGRLIG